MNLTCLRDLFRKAREAWSTMLQIAKSLRSEEHTSELQSRGHLVCRLLLEKKKHGEDKLTDALVARHAVDGCYVLCETDDRPTIVSLLLARHPPLSTLFPYTTLFRSVVLLTRGIRDLGHESHLLAGPVPESEGSMEYYASDCQIS